MKIADNYDIKFEDYDENINNFDIKELIQIATNMCIDLKNNSNLL